MNRHPFSPLALIVGLILILTGLALIYQVQIAAHDLTRLVPAALIAIGVVGLVTTFFTRSAGSSTLSTAADTSTESGHHQPNSPVDGAE